MSPSSRGLGLRPFTAATGVRIPLGTPRIKKETPGSLFLCVSSPGPDTEPGRTTSIPKSTSITKRPVRPVRNANWRCEQSEQSGCKAGPRRQAPSQSPWNENPHSGQITQSPLDNRVPVRTATPEGRATQSQVIPSVTQAYSQLRHNPAKILIPGLLKPYLCYPQTYTFLGLGRVHKKIAVAEQITSIPSTRPQCASRQTSSPILPHIMIVASHLA